MRRLRLHCAFLPAGQGSVIGNPILPVIKLCANPRTVKLISERVDVDVSELLRKEMTPHQAEDTSLECVLRISDGRLIAADVLCQRSSR